MTAFLSTKCVLSLFRATDFWWLLLSALAPKVLLPIGFTTTDYYFFTLCVPLIGRSISIVGFSRCWCCPCSTQHNFAYFSYFSTSGNWANLTFALSFPYKSMLILLRRIRMCLPTFFTFLMCLEQHRPKLYVKTLHRHLITNPFFSYFSSHVPTTTHSSTTYSLFICLFKTCNSSANSRHWVEMIILK